MLNFALTGAIGCVLSTAPNELSLAISSVLDRVGEPLQVAWVLCVARDERVRAKILAHLREGDFVRVEGDIEQHRRRIGDLSFYSVTFVIHSIERIPTSPTGEAP